MDGGRFYVGPANKSDLIEGLATMLRTDALNLGLVPVVADECIFFADIDDFPSSIQLDDFLQKVADFYKAFVNTK